ncbi:ComF family protein [Congregibacter brevis]|uniref:ComF family protein n=1 Tax=Congregibacter brevis TaxID=3081201 RepID=A0ABZ0ICH3_9GAMM|nr:ComF family protein [Congregibacter sp. IMCC45268]
MKSIACRVIDYLAPQFCIYCDQESYRPEAVCEVCRDALLVNDQACPKCALPGTDGRICPNCLKAEPALKTVTAAYEYDPAIAYLMHRWKYLKDRNLSLTAAKMMLNTEIRIKSADIVLATPLHWRRRLRRGFNQSEDLLLSLSRLQPSLQPTPTKVAQLKRRFATKTQAHASRRERLNNLQGAFTVVGDVRGCSIVLIDDVCTTGATGNAMGRALQDAGASEVHLYCLARTPSP